MILNNRSTDRFVPDGVTEAGACARTTHLSIVAHQDDLEILSFHGIKECFDRSDRWFTGVVVTDGAGSARTGAYAKYSDEQMREIRRKEQREAAQLGKYSAVYQLDYSSAQIKSESSKSLIENDLHQILLACPAKTVYLHNPTDSHDTHVAVFLRSIAALRKLPKTHRPSQVWGCEVWRDLDWLTEKDKILLGVSEHPELARELCKIFDSQITGGKRYDLATMARRQAHATFSASHEIDTETGITLAMNLMPLLENPSLDITEFTMKHIDRFQYDVKSRLEKF